MIHDARVAHSANHANATRSRDELDQVRNADVIFGCTSDRGGWAHEFEATGRARPVR
jgi:hypothetical protein